MEANELIEQVEITIFGVDGIMEQSQFASNLIEEFHRESSPEYVNRRTDCIQMCIVSGKGFGICLPRVGVERTRRGETDGIGESRPRAKQAIFRRKRRETVKKVLADRLAGVIESTQEKPRSMETP